MGKTTKSPRSLRLNELADNIIKAEIEDRRKKLGPEAKITKTQIIEEALYRMAAQDPSKRDMIIEALREEPRFAAVAEFLVTKGKDDAKR